MRHTVRDQFGNNYIYDDAMIASPYNNNGSVGYANNEFVDQFCVRNRINYGVGKQYEEVAGYATVVVPDDQPDVVLMNVGWSRFHLVRMEPQQEETKELLEAIDKLEDYPCFDDELVGFIEATWMDSAIYDLQDSLISYIEKKYPNFESWWEAKDPLFNMVRSDMFDGYRFDSLHEVLCYGIDHCYPVFESDGCFIDFDEVKDTWVKHFFKMIRDHYYTARRNGKK